VGACPHALLEQVDWGGGACEDAACAKSIGIAAVLVQAKDEAARAWYLGQAEWLEVPAGGRALWLPVGVVVGGIMHPTACLLTKLATTPKSESISAKGVSSAISDAPLRILEWYRYATWQLHHGAYFG
jgi:hypothetical protein